MREPTIQNRTTTNRKKQKRLVNQHVVPRKNIQGGKQVVDFLLSLRDFSEPKEQILFSIGYSLLREKSAAVKLFLSEYNYEVMDIKGVPNNEFDLLGSTYQFLNSKAQNLERGTFYTFLDIARDLVAGLDFSNGQTILDSACGSGAVLFASNALPHQIVGIDVDPIAVMIAKFNYFIKFPNAEYPRIICDDFFHWVSTNRERFNYHIGNPPYGANLDLTKIESEFVKSGESFSYFIEFGSKLLKKDGVLRFLLPESILNVKKHADIRRFMLQQTNLKKIKRYSRKFDSIMSDVYMVELDMNEPRQEDIIFVKQHAKGETASYVAKSIYENIRNYVFTDLSEQDVAILRKVNATKKYSLSNSVFGLGVVTGDNESKLLSEQEEGAEPIYTGKEVEKYRLLQPKRFLIFDRSKLQQVAPDAIYRAPEKLVYKPINKFLNVALDRTQSLTTNSANIIIPQVADLDIEVIMALLNANLYSYLYLKLFGGINKVAKENLMALPLPEISSDDGKEIKKLISAIEDGDDAELQMYINRNIFKLSDKEIEYINGFIPKATA